MSKVHPLQIIELLTSFHSDEVKDSKGFLLFFSVIPEGKLNQNTKLSLILQG